MLAVRDGLHHQVARDAVAADQFNDDIDIGMIDDQVRIVHDLDRAASHLLRTFGVEVRDHHDLDAAPGTAANLFLVALQDGESAGTHGANAQQANFDRFHHGVSVSVIR